MLTPELLVELKRHIQSGAISLSRENGLALLEGYEGMRSKLQKIHDLMCDDTHCCDCACEAHELALQALGKEPTR